MKLDVFLSFRKVTPLLLFALLLTALMIVTAPTLTFAADAECPEWMNSSKLPECPSSGNMVPETYPMAAIVISDLSATTQSVDSSFTTSVVEKVVAASKKNPPLILLSVTEATHSTVLSAIDKMALSSAEKTRIKSLIVRTGASSYTWQQDFSQSFIDPVTKKPIIRFVDGYPEDRVSGSDIKNLTDKFKACGFQVGPVLDAKDDFKNGNMGGNMETLPGGGCLLGDDHLTESQYTEFSKNMCGGDTLKTPTHWLVVGHTDEIMKVIRDNKKPAPCNFAVSLASPQKALKVLKEKPNDKFLALPKKGATREDILKKFKTYEGLRVLCEAHRENLLKKMKDPGKKDESTPGGRKINFFKYIEKWFPLAHAGGVALGANGKPDPNKLKPKNSVQPVSAVSLDSEPEPELPGEEVCIDMTNQDVLDAYNSSKDLKDYNNYVQSQMNKLRGDVTAKIAKTMPSCKPDFVEVPDLFFGPLKKNDDGTRTPPMGSGLSILPNPTNAITVNNTVIAPEPYNEAFKQDAQKSYESKGLTSEFVDTFDYAHRQQGNLHCSTNTVHVCRPAGGK